MTDGYCNFIVKLTLFMLFKNLNFLFQRRKCQHIFLKAKLISLDAVAPLTLEVYQRNNIKSIYYTTDTQLASVIKDNLVLNDVVNLTGVLVLIGKAFSSNKIVSRVHGLVLIMLLAIRLLINKEKVIHFGFLN